MALQWFNQGLLDLGNKVHNLATDDLRIAYVTNATVPTKTTPVPHFGGTGTTNFAANQIALATSYTGPIALTNKTWTIPDATGPVLRADIVTVAQDAGGATNARWGIVYNNTDANKRALGFVDLGADRSLVAGPLTVDWFGATNDLFKLETA